jgi:hypothetical protein
MADTLVRERARAAGAAEAAAAIGHACHAFIEWLRARNATVPAYGMIWSAETTAVTPLVPETPEDVPETYPFGV